jgi:hypothetical protein
MERRHAPAVSGIDDLRRLLNERLDRRDIALSKRVEDLLRPGYRRKSQNH